MWAVLSNGNLPFITGELEQMILLSIGNFDRFVHSVVNVHYIAILCTFTSKSIIYQTHLSMRKFFYIPSYIPTGVICFQVLSIKFCTLLDKHSKRILLGPSFEFVCFNHEFSVSVNIAFSRYWLVSNVFKVTLFLF